MRWSNRSRRSTATVALLLACATPALAVERKLSDLAYVGHHVEADNAIVIDTSGAAKVRISFASPGVARVQVAPTGTFAPNKSPAVDGPHAAIAPAGVTDSTDALVVRDGSIAIRVDKRHLRVDAYDGEKPTSVEAETTWDDEAGTVGQSRTLGDAERIYGLGQDNANRGTLDRRGTTLDLWTGQQIRSGNVTADYPVSFYLSTGIDGRGYGCFVDSSYRLKFDVGKAHGDRLAWRASGGPIDYYLVAGPSFKTIVDRYTQLTGRPSMLPLWAFGFWQSRCFYSSFMDIDQAASRLQKDGVPLDVMVVDSDWSQFEMNFKWKPKFLGNRTADEWFAYLHGKGLKVIVSTKGPMIRADADIYPDALTQGVFATDGHGNPLTCGYYGGNLLDVTAPNLFPWLTSQLAPLTAQGTDGWWLDLNEPEGEPPQAVYHDGTSADTHNRYSLLNNKAYFDYERSHAPDGRPVILGRAATAGTQRYSGIVWTGDINSDWPTFRAHLPELQNTGLSGLPYWTNDSGGFISGFLNKDRYGAHAELYERWIEFTSFAPIARAHKAGPSEPYEFGPAVEATAKKYLSLRYRLMPYLYTLARAANATGLPIARPLVLEYQDDAGSATAKTEFLFGADLLVAPVLHPGATSRDIYFPPGRWISYDDGFEIEGGRSIGVSAPRDRLPLFVRAGAILPCAPEMTSTSQKAWDPITLDVWPAGESAATLYDDDHETLAFTRGKATTTTFRCAETPGKSVALDIAPSNDQFGPARWIARFHLTSTPTNVSVDGKTLAMGAWSFDVNANVLSVDVPGGRGVARAIVVTLDSSSRPRPLPPKVDVAPTSDESTASARQTAQFLPPPRLPIRIEAANYDKGGEGLAFHVATPAKEGVYRQDGVPIANSTDAGGGYAIAGLKQDDWLAYTVDAGDGGWFTIDARVRGAGGLAMLRERTIPLTSIDATADAAPWSSVGGATPFYLPPGEQIVTARVARPGAEIGNFTFAKIGEPGVAAEAEAGTLVGCAAANDHPGFTGVGFIAGVGRKGTGVTVHLAAPGAGRYVVAIRYANGLEDATLAVTTNGDAPVAATLAGLPNWDAYGEAAVTLALRAGDNAVELRGTDVGVVNLDQLRLICPAAAR